MKVKICIFLFVIITASLSGCMDSDNSTKKLSRQISELHPIEFKTVERYENFKEIADNTNDLIRLLKREGRFDIQELKGTVEEYEKISRILTEYTPLINNYNEVLKSANEYNKYGTTEKEREFYSAIGNFTLETFLIVTAAYAIPAYESVGIVYRASGLNIIAPSCPTCVSIILSNAHWLIRTYMVEKSTEAAEKSKQILESIESLDEIKIIIQSSQYFVDNAINSAYNISSSWDKIRSNNTIKEKLVSI
jgi:hypothetical protein